jgi:putative methionine-R-sulfoxide reductase with GAF domain
MEAIIISSRSINQDKFFQKEAKDKYSKHKKQIELIVKEKHNIISNFQKEIESMGATLRKSKSAAKIFKVKEDESALKR